FKGRHDFIGGNKGAYWHPATHSLGTEQDIRRNAKMLKSPKLTGSAKPRLDFIQNQQSAGFVTPLPQSLKITRIDHPNSSLSLNGLHYYSCCFCSDVLKILQLSVIDMRYSR